MKRLGQFDLLVPLGSGGSANVYLARDLSEETSGRLVALKVLLPELVRRQDALSMFFSEARISSSIDHPNVVKIYGLGRSQNYYCLAQEYIFGANFSEILTESGKKDRPLTVGAILRILGCVASGLDVAHKLRAEDGRRLGLVHRDISGHNIMISFDGHPKLMDFGIAKATDRGFETRVGVVKGKFPYMSPEQTLGKKLDHRSDIFSLGVIAWEAFTGETLFSGHSPGTIMKAIREKPIPPPSSIASQLSPVLDPIVMRALRRDPAYRYQEARELAQAIDEVISSAGLQIDAKSIGDELAGIYGDEISLKTRALQDAIEGRVNYEELANLFNCRPMTEIEAPSTSKDVDVLSAVNFSDPPSSLAARPRVATIAARSTPELENYFQQVEDSGIHAPSTISQNDFMEENEALSRLEFEPASSPLIDISDLLNGWDEVSASSEQDFTNSSGLYIRENGESLVAPSRVRTRRERPVTEEEPEGVTLPARMLPVRQKRVFSDTIDEVEDKPTKIDISVPPSVLRRQSVPSSKAPSENRPRSADTVREDAEVNEGLVQKQNLRRAPQVMRYRMLLLYGIGMFLVGALIALLLSH